MVASTIAVFLAITISGDMSSDCVILDFNADWCKPCQQMQPIMDQAVAEGWIVREIDTDREREMVERWRVTHLPTCIIVRGGKEVDRIVGTGTYEKLRERLSDASRTNKNGLTPTTPTVPIIRGQSPPAQWANDASTSNVALASGQIHPLANTLRDNLQHAAQGSQNPRLDNLSLRHANTDPKAATVRIRIEDRSSIAFGTGTIIDRHGDEALVLTCGHLFRDVGRESNISIDVFVDGRTASLPATIVDFRADDVDIGLLSFRPGQEVSTAQLLPRGLQLQERQSVFSIGCDAGADPTRRDSQISKLNRYVGPSNVEVAGAPIPGRSGGGLFNAQGQLIGVCYAADKEYNEGLYSGPDVVYAQLAKLNLTRLYEGQGMQSAGSEIRLTTKSDLIPIAASSKSPPNTSNSDVFLVVRRNGGPERVIAIPNPPSAIQAIIREADSNEPVNH